MSRLLLGKSGPQVWQKSLNRCSSIRIPWSHINRIAIWFWSNFLVALVVWHQNKINFFLSYRTNWPKIKRRVNNSSSIQKSSTNKSIRGSRNLRKRGLCYVYTISKWFVWAVQIKRAIRKAMKATWTNRVPFRWSELVKVWFSASVSVICYVYTWYEISWLVWLVKIKRARRKIWRVFWQIASFIDDQKRNFDPVRPPLNII